ncbi:MAG TPA: aminotransferase class V-fold PLP-dependent enzyme [Spirochaetia bacterium]|nr:aminotransferase class V-fold PLP-dependent enzyme [Spirochaetia bacterium]
MNEFWSFVKDNIIGRDAIVETPFGERAMLYADHTASGRSVRFIEDYLCSLLPYYGNTHTDDDFTGNFSTVLLEKAIERIKHLVHAGPHHKLMLVGSGATGAIQRLQQILGVYLPPATRARLRETPAGEPDAERFALLGHDFADKRPVVFVGPYEHHSNEVTWRECFAEVVEIGLNAAGLIDLDDLAEKLGSPEYAGRQKIGSFSAASNVSGVRTDVYTIARMLHEAGALACFDFAALAPYVKIDIDRDEDSYFDAIFFSPHKFLGGPGGSGVLIIHDRIYRQDLPPTHGGGGTVDFVNRSQQHYLTNIEGREMAGTPGISQAWKVALAMELKEKMNPEEIERRERELVKSAYERISAEPNVEIIGTAAPADRIGILSFLVRHRGAYLHPRFVTRLLNDLFGIQSRGGCSCAGPYGHRLLSIGDERSEQYRQLILHGVCGVKPGWTRITLHYLLTDEELDFLCEAVLFVAREGRYFLPLYTFDLSSGSWRHADWDHREPSFGLDELLEKGTAAPPAIPAPERVAQMRTESLLEARRWAGKLRSDYSESDIHTLAESPFPFEYFEDAARHDSTG